MIFVWFQNLLQYYYHLQEFVQHITDLHKYESYSEDRAIWTSLHELLYTKDDSTYNSLHAHKCFLRNTLLHHKYVSEDELSNHISNSVLDNRLDSSLVPAVSFKILYETSSFLRSLADAYSTFTYVPR